DIANRMIEMLESEHADCVYASGFPEGTTPIHAISPKYVARRILKNLKTIAHGPDFISAVRRVVKGGKTTYLRFVGLYGMVKIPQSFVVRTPEELAVLRELFGETLGRLRVKDVVNLYGDVDRTIRYLADRRGQSQAPYRINAILNRYEAETGRTGLQSFPVSVGFNIMPICDVDCKFCSFSPQEMDSRQRVTLEEFKQLDWLKYASEIALWGGVGESLINPEFLDIFNYALERFPHLKVSLSTIGKSLRPEVSEQLVGRLSFLNVSLNAARPETHAKIVKAGRFERVIENIRNLTELRRARGTPLPRVHISMVVMRENVEELPEFIDLAADLGADHAVASHFLATTIEGKRKAGEESSLYQHRELADAMLAKAHKRARARGISVTLPPLFSKTDCNVLFGSRSEFGPSGDCLLPWNTCHLSVDERGRRQMLFCCSGMYLRAFYDVRHMDEANFMKLWNGPIPQHFRATTNSDVGNPLCTFCKTEDRFDPTNKKIYDIDQTFGQTLEAMGGQAGQEPLVTLTKKV
ncbi:MAG: radical SAM protein, partial [Terriglobia bacterium]